MVKTGGGATAGSIMFGSNFWDKGPDQNVNPASIIKVRRIEQAVGFDKSSSLRE
jgi:hypothetical protein